jgi:anion-transporting  ArsA/GET3 family ATPase/DNA-binding NarL/FixJ family response regulator
MMLDTRTTFDALVHRHAAEPEQADRILANRFYKNISGALSGTQEYMAAEKLYELHSDPRFDVVVVDTPPTRNALDFLEAPKRLTRFLDHRLYRLLLAPARSGLRVLNMAAQPVLRTIGKVVGTETLSDAIAFFQAFDGMEAGFRERAEHVVGLLRAPETAYVFVASPRHDTIDEAAFFAGTLHRSELQVAALVVNRLHPPFGPGDAAEEARAREAARDGQVELAALWENLAELRDVAADEEAELGRPAGRDRRRSGGAGAPAGWRRARPGRAPRDGRAPVRVTSRPVHVLIATDAQWVLDDITAALGGPDTSFTVCHDGRVVAGVVSDRTPDIAILDLQIGSMGGMAVTMDLRLDESSGNGPHVPVLMLLDRAADLHLARRSGADGWLVKPLDPLRMRRAAHAVAGGGSYTDGLLPDPAPLADNAADEPRPTSQMANRQPPARMRSRPAGATATGCSAAWLARHVRDVEAGSSNP